jgi:hypothetical protein
VELRDFIVTPLIILIIYAGAYLIRPHVTDELNYKYFFPALTARIFGAIALGFIYQFYYRGGDTLNYHVHGSRHIWDAFMESPSMGFKLLVAKGQYGPGYWDYAEKIWYYRDQNSYFVIRIAAIFDLITFSSYSGTAVLFGVLAFTGSWMMFVTFSDKNPGAIKFLAVSCLFIPSIIFWGSGILKDTLTLSFVGIATYHVSKVFIDKKITLSGVLVLLFSFYCVYSLKKYVLISFLAGMVIWVSASYFLRVRSMMLKIMLVPFVVIFCVVASYVTVNRVVRDDPKYSLEKIAQTSMVTAYDIRYGWGKEGGSGYSLGELDGTIGTMVKLAPKAINVSLFRPYVWEVRNPLMALSALESLFTLVLTLYVLYKVRGKILLYANAEIVFCLVFALIFAFGVGVSTYNFGTLARYKILLMPYYLSALALLYYYWKRDRKRVVLDETEN